MSNFLLRTFLSLVSVGFKIERQELDIKVIREEFVDIKSVEEAVYYLFNVDATHPLVWYIFATESLEEFPFLDEPEYYAAFSAILGHGSQTYKFAIAKLIQRIYFGPEKDKDLFQLSLTYVIEEALRVRGWSFITEIISWISELELDEIVLQDVYSSTLHIRNHHLKKSAENSLTVNQDGFLGNSIFRDSILDASTDS
jgi:hypothetical protein